jgi:hypothetical protein
MALGPRMTGAYGLVGQRFGHLLALSVSGKTKSCSYLLLCRCDCGAEKALRYEHLRSGGVRSCGCLSAAMSREARAGIVYQFKPRPIKRPPTVVGDTVIIHLSKELQAVVDAVDAELANNNWSSSWRNNGYYACRTVRKRTVFLHRIVAERAGLNIVGLEVDHKDGNPLNCRRGNLRAATREQNARNMKLSRANTSGAKGVRRKSPNRWSARIHANGREHHLGSFLSREEAAEAYRKASAELHGEFGKTG